VTSSGERDLSRIGALDYALMTVGSCLAAMSGGLSVVMPNVGAFAVFGIVIGACMSYAARIVLLRSPLVRIDGFLYAAAMIASFVFGSRLQSFMPDGGYTQDVMAAGWLTWMLILGSFFTWQDSTLLFQAVPSIALFGLAGIYGTFDGVTFAFFGFLLCLATLFARAHRRAMLVQAAESGYFTRGLAPGTPTPSVETTPGLAQRMMQGPWKWIAGPGWALLSALVIVLVSLLGAPVLKVAMAPVSGFAKVGLPNSVHNRQVKQAARLGNDAGDTVPVGQGPNSLSKIPVFEIRMDSARYLRMATYYSFSPRTGWSSLLIPPDVPLNNGAATEYSIAAIKPSLQQNIRFDIRMRRAMLNLPVPGFANEWDAVQGIQIEKDGRIDPPPGLAGQSISGSAVVAAAGTPTSAETDLGPLFGYNGQTLKVSLPQRVVDFVNTQIAGAKTDYEKAEKIREAIASRIKYNINAEAVPASADPVDYTLFDHQEAYCDIYATCMTLMARQAGIPARFVYGYLPDEMNHDKGGTYVVLESDKHAWSELYFKDYGWVVFDATDGADSVAGAGRGSANDSGPFWSRPWVLFVIDVLIGLAVLTGIVVGGRAIYLSRRARTPRTILDRAFVRFSHILERASGSRRVLGATPDEYLASIRPLLGDSYPAAAALNAKFVALLFSPRPTTPADVTQILAEMKALKIALSRKR
jgi:transglutaminase-like putative cysteine protease